MGRSNYFSLHTHSSHSSLDGMTSVTSLVERAHDYEQPGMGLTDHGNMAGTVKLYKACMERGMKPFPGVEGYLLDPGWKDGWEDSGSAERFHLGLLALNLDGYQGLIDLVSLSHTRPRFNRFPRFDLSDLLAFGQEYGDDVVLTTGCYFGYLQQTLMKDGFDRADRVLKMFKQAFPHTYVEVQNHNIEHDDDPDVDPYHDDDIVLDLFDLAAANDLRVVATQDSHYTDQKHKKAHALMKRMTFGNDNEFPGDSFHLASGEWVAEHYDKKQWAHFEESYGEILDLNTLRIKPLDTFTPDVPSMVDDSQGELSEQCVDALNAYLDTLGISEAKEAVYVERLSYELGVIEHLGMAGYFIIVLDFVDWCRRQGICIEARGSASGSLVNYLIGVTQTDPIIWKLDFERFLSKDRIKPPDIDMDIEDVRRGEALAYLMAKHDALQIGTFSKMGITVDPETGNETGSIIQSWIQGKRRQCMDEAWKKEQKKAKPLKYQAEEAGKIKFASLYGHVKTLKDVRKAAPEDYEGLRELSKIDVNRSYGVHAGGILLSGNEVFIGDYIPKMLVASSDTIVTQFDMDDVEEFGLVKIDVLGQTSLTVMRVCQELMGRENPTDFTWIPENDQATLTACRSGRMNTGIFHQEAYTKSRGCKELGVKNQNDLVLMQALYMPGCLDVAPGQTISQKDLYLKRRKSRSERENVEYISDEFEAVLKETHGAVVYQEQVINIMRRLGMGIEGINKFFKVVKDSGKGATARNQERMAAVRKEFTELCEARGIDADEAWLQTSSFVTYSFNRAHATAYGLRTYRTAYLKTHYPLEYMTALLVAWAGKGKPKKGQPSKEDIYVEESRRIKIPLLAPDINLSGSTWTLDEDKQAIRKGLVSIKGVGETTAKKIEATQPYESMKDFCERSVGVSGTKGWLKDGTMGGILAEMQKVGVLRSIGVSR